MLYVLNTVLCLTPWCCSYGGPTTGQVTVTGKELTNLQTVLGALVVSLVAWVLIIAVGTAVFWKKLPPGPLDNLSLAVEEGAKMVIRRLLKISTPFFLIVSLVFLLGMTWRFCLPLFVSGMLAACVCTLVLRASTAAHARCAVATVGSSLAGFETALHSGIVVGVSVMAPMALWAAVMCLVFHFDQMAILAFGFGVTLANLLIHVGGVIFSKSSQVAHEKRDASLLLRQAGECGHVHMQARERVWVGGPSQSVMGDAKKVLCCNVCRCDCCCYCWFCCYCCCCCCCCCLCFCLRFCLFWCCCCCMWSFVVGAGCV